VKQKNKTHLVSRFWSKVVKTESCWTWIGHRNAADYGTLGTARGGKIHYAHRLSWEIHFGDIPLGLLICHHCDNPPCVNPSHLFLGTHRDNTADSVKKGRRASKRGELNGRAKLTSQDVADVFKLRAAGSLQREIGSKFDVTQAQVSSILLGKAWAKARSRSRD